MSIRTFIFEHEGNKHNVYEANSDCDVDADLMMFILRFLKMITTWMIYSFKLQTNSHLCLQSYILATLQEQGDKKKNIFPTYISIKFV